MRVLSFILVVFFLLSCDPEICSDVNINNNLNLNLNFIRKDKSFSNDIFFLNKKSDISFDSYCGFGPLTLDFTFYDSIYITDTRNKILKVYKEDTPGKNIYNTSTDWIFTRTDNFYLYEYEITEEDLE